MQNPCVQLLGVSHDRTAWTVVYMRDRQPIVLPPLDRAYAVAEMFRNLFPARQNHSNIVTTAEIWRLLALRFVRQRMVQFLAISLDSSCQIQSEGFPRANPMRRATADCELVGLQDGKRYTAKLDVTLNGATAGGEAAHPMEVVLRDDLAQGHAIPDGNYTRLPYQFDRTERRVRVIGGRKYPGWL